MTIWSSQLRHNFFNHTLFSCVEQEIDRIKGCILRNMACCVGISTAVLWFSTESKSSDYPALSPSALHPETQETGWCPGVPLVRMAPFQQTWKLEEAGGRWAGHGKPRIYDSILLPIKLSLSELWLLELSYSCFCPLLHFWSLWKSSRQHPRLISHAWSSQHT